MKKLIYLFSITTTLLFAFTFNVKAATYQADELTEGQLLLTNDIIEFGSGNSYDTVLLLINLEGGMRFNLYNRGESFVLPQNYYVRGDGTINHSTSALLIGLHTIHSFFTIENDNTLLPFQGDRQVLTINEGETKRIFLHYEGGSQPISYRCEGRQYKSNPPYVYDDLGENIDYIDIKYGEYDFLAVNFYCPDGRSTDNFSGFCHININNISKTNTPEEVDDIDEPIIATPQIPSTVPNGIAQVALGTGGKDYANVKVLNQFPHDSINQKFIADLYAAKLKKKATILVQKNVIPPWGVKNEWKNESHTLRWKDLNVKKGDTILVVWYTPSFFGHTSTLKYIMANVVEDRVVEFTVPSMGEMSAISIVKLD